VTEGTFSVRGAPFSKGVLSIISIKLLYEYHGYLPCLVLCIRKYQIDVSFLIIGIIIPSTALPAATVSMYGVSFGKVPAVNI